MLKQLSKRFFGEWYLIIIEFWIWNNVIQIVWFQVKCFKNETHLQIAEGLPRGISRISGRNRISRRRNSESRKSMTKAFLKKKYNKKIQRRLPPPSDGPKFPRIKKSHNQIPGLLISWQDWKDNHCCCCSQLLLKLLPLWPKIWGKKSLDICLQKVIFRCFFYSCRTEKKCPVQNESTVLFRGINLKTLDLVTPLLLLEQLLGLKYRFWISKSANNGYIVCFKKYENEHAVSFPFSSLNT